jgi:hypothetical protein
MQLYVEAWAAAAAPENVVTQVRPTTTGCGKGTSSGTP